MLFHPYKSVKLFGMTVWPQGMIPRHREKLAQSIGNAVGNELVSQQTVFDALFETSFFQANHLDSVLTQFNLFGGLIVIRTSTVAFLATLVIILVVLARLDLIPRSFSALSGSTCLRRGRQHSPLTTHSFSHVAPRCHYWDRAGNSDRYRVRAVLDELA